MTGQEITAIRTALGLSPVDFSEVIGVSFSTVYRWEALEDPRPDPLQRRLLIAAEGVVKDKTLLANARVELPKALVFGGPLRALHVLLNLAFGNEAARA